MLVEEFNRQMIALAKLNEQFDGTIRIERDGEEFAELVAVLNPAAAKPNWAKGANNMIQFNGKNISAKLKGDSVWSDYDHYIMPDIKKVSVKANGETANAVIVDFADGTSEKAVVSWDDTFSLEQGISICITKKLLSINSGGQGNSIYNKIIKHAMKVYDNDFKEYMHQKEESERIAVKKQKVAEKKAARKARREAEERERLVSIQAEAYLRAMREYGKESAGNANKF